MAKKCHVVLPEITKKATETDSETALKKKR